MNRGWIVFIIILLSVSNTLALGIAYEYMNGNTITVPQGNERIFTLTLQNDQDKQISVNVIVESQIAKLRGKSDYTIYAKNYDTPVDIDIKIPNNATINSSYAVHYTVTPLADNSTGQVPFSVRYDRAFTVIVGKPAKQEPLSPEPVIEQPAITQETTGQKTTSVGITILLIICIITILGFVWHSSKKITNKIKIPKIKTENQELEQNDKPAVEDTNQNIISNDKPGVVENKSNIPESSIHIQKQEEQINSDKIPNEYLAPQNTEMKVQEIKTQRVSRIPELKAKIDSTFNQQASMQESKQEKILPKASAEQRFFVANGPTLEDLMQLQDALETMNDDQYFHHVHDNTNDFAAWTQGVFGMNELAQKMRLAKNRNDMLEVLEHEL